ncbi:MAG: sigma-54-dependent Fis family transcriptional regulator [Candidatus Obscuribacterales bacterium]|nr:sigma-54-dependent Fis family transcriptional regulator [Steroidobacteraceae bacterium]
MHLDQPQKESVSPTAMGPLIGASAEMQQLFRMIERAAPTDASVFIIGESGTGKELVAQLIHQHSNRASGPFEAINCGAIPPGLVEAELFGYEKGSFTGASRTHAGVFERAEGGTLLLDEITEMPLAMQTRLLRIIETRKFPRVGGNTEISTDVRIIAATNRCPMRTAQDGQLREDILYRLAVFPVTIPALRERGDDVLLLADHFLAELNARAQTNKRFSSAAIGVLKQHTWPGNVRELKNCVERAFILDDQTLELTPLLQHDLGSEVAQHRDNLSRLNVHVGARIDEVERSLIEATLEYFQGNKRRAAAVLGCSVKTLYNKLNVYSRGESNARRYSSRSMDVAGDHRHAL